jgi:Uma2 family endonuclease
MQSVLERDFSEPFVVTDHVKKNGVPKPFRWTVREYYQMAELGFFQGKRVELIRGEIVEMSPMKSPHATSIQLAAEVLSELFKKGFVVRSQLPMSFSKADEPEPDIAVVTGSIRDYADGHPKSAVLLVEISNSTLRFDREEKAELYAENNIGEYWIVNLKQRRLEVHRRPQKDKNRGFFYSEVVVVSEDESIAPLAKPKAKIKVADILP